MTPAQAEAALEVGRQAARRALASGANLLIAGDMGIGNTTASAALICRLAQLPPERIVGRGTGLDEAGLEIKRRVVRTALARVAERQLSALETLTELGGLEIAAMAGFYLRAPSTACRCWWTVSFPAPPRCAPMRWSRGWATGCWPATARRKPVTC